MSIRSAVAVSVLSFVLSGALATAKAFDEAAGKKDAVEPGGESKQETSNPAAGDAENRPTGEKKNGTGELPEKSPVEQWAELKAKMDAIAKRLAELEKEFADADRDEKTRIRDEFLVELSTYNASIKPKMRDLAPVVYEQDPTNFLAGKFVVESNYLDDHFDEAAAAADKLLADGLKSKRLVNMAIVSHFAIHDFETAKELMGKAEEEGTLDLYSLVQDPQLAFHRAAEYVNAEIVANYIEFWEEEKKIRAAEAELKGDDALPRVALETDRGKIVLELFENEAPNTVANFISLVEDGFYDGTKFHNVVAGFAARGGDPNSKDDDPTNDGLGGPGYTIKSECFRENARKHFRGSLSMYHTGKDTGGSQFFLTRLPTPHLNPDRTTETGHTVFGRIVEGLRVAESLQVGDAIKSAEVLNKRDHEYKPLTSKDAAESPEDDDSDETSDPDASDKEGAKNEDRGKDGE